MYISALQVSRAQSIATQPPCPFERARASGALSSKPLGGRGRATASEDALRTMLWASLVDSAATSSVHIRSPCCTTVSCLFRNFRQHFLKRGYFAILDSNHIII